MRNEERRTRNGERGTENEERRTRKGERGTENEERRTRNGERGTENEERRTRNGERGTENEERRAVEYASNQVPGPASCDGEIEQPPARPALPRAAKLQREPGSRR